MKVNMTKTSYLLSTLLLVGCVSSTPHFSFLKNDKPEQVEITTNNTMNEPLPSDTQTPELSAEQLPTPASRPIDVAPLLSNYLAAKLSEYEGKVADAAFFYDRAEAADPENKDLKEKAFSLQLALGNLEEAVRLAKGMITKEDPAPISYILLGADALHQNALAESKRYFNLAKSISPVLVQFHVIQAYLDLEMGQPIDKVVEQIKKLPPMEGLVAVRHYHLGRLYEKAGKLELAQREYEFSMETDPASSFTVLALERLYHKTNQSEKTPHIYKAFMAENPDNVMLNLSQQRLAENTPYTLVEPTLKQDIAAVVFELSTLMSAQKLQLAAAQLLNTALHIHPQSDAFKFYAGMLQEQGEAYDDAIQTYNSIENDQNTWLGGQIRIADIYNNLGQHQKAINMVENLRKDNPHSILKRILAEMYYAQENYGKAIQLYDEILQSEKEDEAAHLKNNYWVYFARGSAYERLKEYDKAEQDLKKSLAIQPNNATVLNYLGYMWIERDQHIDEAMQLIGRALVMRPNDAAILDSMGWVLYKKQEYAKAAAFLEKANQIQSNDPTILMHLGDVYEKLNRMEEAHHYWTKALEFNPETAQDKAHIQNKLNKLSRKLKK